MSCDRVTPRLLHRMRVLKRRRSLGWAWTMAAAIALLLALGAPPAGAEVVGGVEHFPTACGVGRLVSGPDGNVWFSCFRENPPPRIGGQSLIGKVTPTGRVEEFALPAGV